MLDLNLKGDHEIIWECNPTGDLHDEENELASALENWNTSPKSPGETRILTQKSNVNLRNREGYTVLATAARHGLRDTILQLLYLGANPNIKLPGNYCAGTCWIVFGSGIQGTQRSAVR
jgi:ankyrin repeat protein